MIITPEIFDKNVIKSVQTTRQTSHTNGKSKKPFDCFNLGVFTEDKHVDANIKHLTKQCNMPHEPVFMQQVHEKNVIEYKQPPIKHGENIADACFTHQKNIICSVLTADCLPVLIADKQATVVAAVHCGWRGLYKQILKKTIKQLAVDPGQLSCWLGPCISYKSYRVDENFRKNFVQQDSNYAHCFYRSQKGSWHADLKKIAVYQLEKLGVKDITQSPYCTHTNKSMFYSYRRDGKTGRMASMIWLP